VESPGQVNTNRLSSDRTRLWLLFGFVALSGLAAGVPFFNAGFFFLGLMALVILMVRYGYLFSFSASLLAIAVCTLLYGPILAGGILIMILSPGLLMGYKARAFGSPNQILIWGMIPALLPLLVVIVYYPFLISQTPEFVAEMHKQLTANAGLIGLSGADLDQALNSIKATVELTIRLAPGILFTTMIAIVVLGYLGAVSMGSRFGAIIPVSKPLSLWRASEYWLIPLGLSLFFVLLGGGTLMIIGENMLVFLVHVYAFFGICLLEYYFRQILVSGWLRLVLYLLGMVIGIVFIPILAFLALIDSRFDIRKINAEKKTNLEG
jgi:hypothetical protein